MTFHKFFFQTKLDSAVDDEERRISEEASARQQAEAEALDRLRAEKLARISAIGDQNSTDPAKAEEAAGRWLLAERIVKVFSRVHATL